MCAVVCSVCSDLYIHMREHNFIEVIFGYTPYFM